MNHRTFSEVYRAFEDKFRGDRELISSRQRVYEPLVQTVPEGQRRRAIDLGSGRGEWLALTREWGFEEAVGVEPDVTMHEYVAPGVEIVALDALSYLESVPDGSAQLISAFHVIEHVTADYGFRMISEMHRVLADGGVMILETPNPENLMVGLWSFHLDPTHNRPIPPVLLDFLVDEGGFNDHAIVRLNGSLTTRASGSILARLAQLGPDYSVVAIKSAENVGKSQSFSLQFSQESPADYDDLIEREQAFAHSLQELRVELHAVLSRIGNQDAPLLKTVSEVSGRLEQKGEQVAATLLSEIEGALAMMDEQASRLIESREEVDKLVVREVEAVERARRAEIARLDARLDGVWSVVTDRTEEIAIVARKADRSIGNLERKIENVEKKLEAGENLHSQELSDLCRQIADLRSEIEGSGALAADLARQRDDFVNSRSWRITSPLRILARVTFRRNVERSGLSHATKPILNRPSLTTRAVRIAAVQAFDIVSRSPRLVQALSPIVNYNPAFKQRLRTLLVPQHLVDAMTPFQAVDGSGGRTHSRSERLLGDRLAWARTMPRESTDWRRDDASIESGREPARRRLAYVSPMPPDRSGIADYSAQLLPELQRLYDVTVIVVMPDSVLPDLREKVDVQGVEWFERHADQFDRIVYHFGNSLFHHHMLPLLRRIPGVVVLHDFYLSGMLAHLELYGGWGPVWSAALFESHGYNAIIERLDPDRLEHVINTYPASFEVIAQATGIITHSQFSRELAHRFYPACGAEDWQVVPLCRVPRPANERSQARAALGLDDDDFVVCSFGFVGYTKLNHRLLDAWLASPLANDRACKLFFVGAAHQDAYSTDLLNRIAARGNGRVSVTGFVEPDQYADYLGAADVGVQLRSISRGETSAAVLDCMAYGLPTIVNANGSMAELPADRLVLLDDHFEDRDLQAALTTLYQDGGRRAALGEAASEYLTTHHSAETAAHGYRDAIEAFYANAHAAYDHRRMGDLLATDGQTSVDDATATLGIEIGMPRPAKRLFVDVSALVREDLRSGIQRVVRATLLELLKQDLDGSRLEPVWLNNDNSEWRYYHARRFTSDFLAGKPISTLTDDPVEVEDGDVFLGLDFFAHGIVGAYKTGLFDEWRRKNVHIAFIVYDILPLTMPDRFPDDSTSMHTLWMDVLSKAADQLICISAAVADEVRGYMQTMKLPRAEAIDVASWVLGADIRASAPTRGMSEADHRNLKLVSRNRSFLMVGTIEPRKGHRDILKAFEHRWAAGSNDLLVLIGSVGWKGVSVSQSRGLPETIRMLQQHPENGRRLIWFSSATDELLENLYRSATALVAASEGEGFGLPLVEAAQRGLPIIARDLPVFREVAGKHAFFFAPTSSEGLAKEIDQWVDLYAAGSHPSSHDMLWLTWSDSAALLWQLLRTSAAARHAEQPASGQI